MTYHFDFAIGARVTLVELNIKARVVMVRYDGFNEEYYVSYWYDGELKQHWIHREDIK